MTRVKRGNCARQKRHKLLKFNRSFSGVHSRLFRLARQQRVKALRSAFTGRKEFRRERRSLWIQRIQFALRQLRFTFSKDVLTISKEGFDSESQLLYSQSFTYSSFIYHLKKQNILLNRKILAQLAIFDPFTFARLLTPFS